MPKLEPVADLPRPAALKIFRPINQEPGVPSAVPMRITNDDPDSREAEIMLYDEIGANPWGGGLDAKTFAENLKALGPLNKITCRVNCPGGDVFDGMAMFNTLVKHPAEVTMCVDGLAASAASFVVQAASPGRLFMAENALMMIHNAQGMTMGDKHEHDKTSEVLDKVDDTIAGTYAARSGRKADTFKKMMDAETWMTGPEAVEHKLADETTPAKKIAASFDPRLLNRYQHAPADVAARLYAIALNVIPPDPPGGDGVAVAGDWEAPNLSDFTDKKWADLSDADRKKIAAYYAWYDNLDSFANLKLPHHFYSGKDKGKASLNGVRNALARLPQTEGIPEAEKAKVKAHLEAHMPKASDDEDGDDEDESDIAKERTAARLRVLEIEAAMEADHAA